jgi:hypothetical protein
VKNRIVDSVSTSVRRIYLFLREAPPSCLVGANKAIDKNATPLR